MWGQSHIFFRFRTPGYALTYTVKSTAVLKLAQVREFYRYYLPAYVSDSPSNVMYFMNYGDRDRCIISRPPGGPGPGAGRAKETPYALRASYRVYRDFTHTDVDTIRANPL